MSNFREQPPANTGRPTFEADPAGSLFNASYVFGAQTFAIDETPGPAAFQSTPDHTTEAPSDLAIPAQVTPTPAAMGGPNVGSDSTWVQWPSGQTTIVLSIPNAADIRAVWIPIIAFPFVVSPGNAPGSVIYKVTTGGSELVPIPGGNRQVALTAATALKGWSNVWVYVTGLDYGPSKGGVTETLAANLGYDNLVIGNPTLISFWPLNDAPGTTACADLGPANNPMQALNGILLGASEFIPNNQTCAQSDGASGTGLIPQLALSQEPIGSVEFWVLPIVADSVFLCSEGVTPGGPSNSFTIQTIADAITVYADYTGYPTNVVCGRNIAHHFVVTVNNLILDVYLDGTLIFTYPSFSWFHYNLGFLYNPNNDTDNTPGKLCNVATYSGVLSLAEIRSHYAAGITGA